MAGGIKNKANSVQFQLNLPVGTELGKIEKYINNTVSISFKLKIFPPIHGKHRENSFVDLFLRIVTYYVYLTCFLFYFETCVWMSWTNFS